MRLEAALLKARVPSKVFHDGVVPKSGLPSHPNGVNSMSFSSFEGKYKCKNVPVPATPTDLIIALHVTARPVK